MKILKTSVKEPPMKRKFNKELTSVKPQQTTEVPHKYFILIKSLNMHQINKWTRLFEFEKQSHVLKGKWKQPEYSKNQAGIENISHVQGRSAFLTPEVKETMLNAQDALVHRRASNTIWKDQALMTYKIQRQGIPAESVVSVG